MAGPSQLLCKASLQEFTSLQIATGNLHPDPWRRGFESFIKQTKNPPQGQILCLVGDEGLDLDFVNPAPMVEGRGCEPCLGHGARSEALLRFTEQS